MSRWAVLRDASNSTVRSCLLLRGRWSSDGVIGATVHRIFIPNVSRYVDRLVGKAICGTCRILYALRCAASRGGGAWSPHSLKSFRQVGAVSDARLLKDTEGIFFSCQGLPTVVYTLLSIHNRQLTQQTPRSNVILFDTSVPEDPRTIRRQRGCIHAYSCTHDTLPPRKIPPPDYGMENARHRNGGPPLPVMPSR